MVRRATPDDADAIGRLLYEFNREYDEPTPEAPQIAARIRAVMATDTVVLLAGDGPDGLAVLRFRPSIWSAALECYLAELYVVPERRGHGLGRALMEAAIASAWSPPSSSSSAPPGRTTRPLSAIARRRTSAPSRPPS